MMIRSRAIFGTLVVGALVINCQSTTSAPWHVLFDGKSLDAWRGYKGAPIPSGWHIADGTLAKEAHTPIVVPIAFDHAISVNTYTTLALATGLLASSVVGSLDSDLTDSLLETFAEVGDVLSEYQDQVANSAWLATR